MGKNSKKNNTKKKKSLFLFLVISSFTYVLLSSPFPYKPIIFPALVGMCLSGLFFSRIIRTLKREHRQSLTAQKKSLNTSFKRLESQIGSLDKKLDASSLDAISPLIDSSELPHYPIINSFNHCESYVIQGLNKPENVGDHYKSVNVNVLKRLYKKRGLSLKVLKARHKPVIGKFKPQLESNSLGSESVTEFPFSTFNLN